MMAQTGKIMTGLEQGQEFLIMPELLALCQ
jgi:hypothetical protein